MKTTRTARKAKIPGNGGPTPSPSPGERTGFLLHGEPADIPWFNLDPDEVELVAYLLERSWIPSRYYPAGEKLRRKLDMRK